MVLLCAQVRGRPAAGMYQIWRLFPPGYMVGSANGCRRSPSGVFDDLDAIVPVPLHWLRQIRRGYNQSERLAQGISRICHVPVWQPAIAGRHRTQTALAADARRRNVTGIFQMKKHAADHWRELNRPPRLLLVDDVCTTGATLSSLAETLTQALPGVRLRILTLAVTDY